MYKLQSAINIKSFVPQHPWMCLSCYYFLFTAVATVVYLPQIYLGHFIVHECQMFTGTSIWLIQLMLFIC